MNLLVVTWSMFAAACAMLGLIQIFLFLHSRRDLAYLLSAFMAFSAVLVTFLEMILFSTPDPARYQNLLLWQNFAIAAVLILMTWSLRVYLPAARTWAAVLITVLWSAGLLVNFLLPGNLTFVEIHSMDSHLTFWGEAFFVPVGTVNRWKWLADVTVILIPLYMIDAAWRGRDSRRRRRGIEITIGAVLFMLFAGFQAIVVDAGLVKAPYMIGAAFLSVVFAMTWVYARDAIRARKLAVEVVQAHRETERMMRTNLLGEVASALAHEINQPLAAILGNAQAAQKFLSRPAPDFDEIRDILADIVRDDKRARDVILNMRRMLQGDESYNESVNVESVISEVIEFVSSEFDKSDIVVRFDRAGQLPEVRCGPVALQQVVLNLLINSKQALLASGAGNLEIHVHLREIRGGAQIEVRDFGPGVADEVRDNLFEPFVTTKQGSIGMGLAISRRIVEAHGGQLTAETASGGGARFVLWLPEKTHE